MNYGICMACIRNIGPLIRVYNTRFRKRMKNEERAHLNTHNQKESEDVKNNMAQMTSLLEQLLWAWSGKGISSQQLTMLSPSITLVILDSQNMEANPFTKPQGTMSILITCLITLAQVSATIYLTMEGSHRVESSDHPEQDKRAIWEEILRAVETYAWC